jgi:hypothetical protein
MFTVFSGWGYKNEIWENFVNYEKINFPKKDQRHFENIISWSMGGLQLFSACSDFSKIEKLILFSPTLHFMKDQNYPGQSFQEIETMKSGIQKSPKAVLASFTKRSKSGINKKYFETNKNSLRNGLIFLRETDLRKEEIIFAKKNYLFAAKNDQIIPLKQSEFFAEKFSLELKVFNTANHAFFLEEKYKKEIYKVL